MLVAELPPPPAPVAPPAPAAIAPAAPAAPTQATPPPVAGSIALDPNANYAIAGGLGTDNVITDISIDTLGVDIVAVNFKIESISNGFTTGATMNLATMGTGNDWGTCYCDAKATKSYWRQWKVQQTYNKYSFGGWGSTNIGTANAIAGNTWATVNLNVKRWKIASSWGQAYFIPADPPPLSKVDEFRKKLRENMQPEIVTKNRNLWGIDLTEQEIRARTLLLELIGEEAFRRYLRRGFIVVKGMTGTLYKISGGNTRIISYVQNIHGRFEAFEEFCVQFKEYNLPFTDGVIMRKLLVESDEFQLRKVANVWQINKVNKAQPMVAAAG